MALTQEQLDYVEYQNALNQSNLINQQDAQRAAARMEAVKLAKETLIENARSKPVGERDITAADITAFADTLVNYMNT
jgi:hypothetical protein|tara:strand:+ start:375 stop:608 length:234 start_codon:yes stop_codon:yes gene_type:complete